MVFELGYRLIPDPGKIIVFINTNAFNETPEHLKGLYEKLEQKLESAIPFEHRRCSEVRNVIFRGRREGSPIATMIIEYMINDQEAVELLRREGFHEAVLR